MHCMRHNTTEDIPLHIKLLYVQSIQAYTEELRLWLVQAVEDSVLAGRPGRHPLLRVSESNELACLTN